MSRLFLVLFLVIPFHTFADSSKVIADVSGMSCASCAGKIEGELRKLPEVDSVDISVASGKVTIFSKKDKKLNNEQIKKAVEAAGYQVKTIQN